MPTEDLELQRALAVRAVAGGLLRLRWLAAATRVELAMHRHMRALKYGYNPDQPRVPKHEDGAGQWTLTDANGNPVAQRRVRLAGDVPTNDPPEVPKEKPKLPSERARVRADVMNFLRQVGGDIETAIKVMELPAWLMREAAGMGSYFDPPKSLDELQQAASSPRPGYDIHHIVQRNQEDVFGSEVINRPDNLALIPRMKHWEINSWYETPNGDYNWQSPRAYLDGRNWDVQRNVGLNALRMVGVLKP